ncbi:MAG: hypothetical protein HY852_17420 [Bradyrhizobium sp.]|uniref:hypothetical protein n=1 Tax=Bradyrhizobium sp. TaxID=376 RepID=UPI0025C043D7|nr:hypothetical protein [Bradyrhizobium sp.]MBI5263591.1 hypothetical protein [Bradyrhizobium sp.]
MAAARADTAPAVLKSVDSGEQIYQTETGERCSVQMWLKQDSDHSYLRLRHPPLSCHPALKDDMAAAGRLLESMANDGVVIGDLKGFGLGRIRHAAWKQQIADCFLHTRDTRNPRAPDGPALVRMLTRCDVFAELKAAFEKSGARLVVWSIEKVETINLRDIETLRREGIAEEWIRAHRNQRGIVPVGGLIYFRIAPYP